MLQIKQTCTNKKALGIIFCILVFIIYLPIVNKINFTQNDDWYYYAQVERFLQGNLRLLPKVAPTFYLQGVVASLFSTVFGLNNIPFLTLLISLLNIFIFYLILSEILEQKPLTSLLLSAILFFNPLFQYAVLGFMTEQYFLLFLLIGVYFTLKYEKEGNIKSLWFSNIASLLGLFVRQVSLVFPIAAALYFFIKHKRQAALYQTGFSILLAIVYLLIPKTAEMTYKTYQFHHLLDFNYTYAVAYGSLLYLAAFSIPILVIILGQNIKKPKVIPVILLAPLLYLTLQFFFKPMSVSWGEFPYFENTWERTGFLARDMHGTKYQFRGIFDLYRYWDLTAKILVALFISVGLLVNGIRKRLLSFETIFICLYIGLMFLTVTFYDRYILVILPLLLLWLAKMLSKDTFYKNSILGVFAVFLVFYSYNFVMDFVLREHYVWSRITKLSETKISATAAWNEKYGTAAPTDVRYLFSYDSPNVAGIELKEFTLREEYKVDFPFNLHIQPKIYLYEKSL